MKQMFGIAAILAALVVLPVTISAQAVTAADAKPFLGAWVLMLDTPQGAMAMNVAVKNTDGKIIGEMGSDMLPTQTITDVTKTGTSLLMKYTLDMQGQAIPVSLTLTPAEGKMNFALDFAQGQFMLSGEATKQQ